MRSASCSQTPSWLTEQQTPTEYRLRHAATPFYATSTSPVVGVRVGVRLTPRSNRTSMSLGLTATMADTGTNATAEL